MSPWVAARLARSGLPVALLLVEDVDRHRVGRPPAQAVVEIGHGPDQALPAVGEHLGLVHHHALVAHVGQQVGVGRVHDGNALQVFQALLHRLEVDQLLGRLRWSSGFGRGFGRNGWIAVPEPAFAVAQPVGRRLGGLSGDRLPCRRSRLAPTTGRPGSAAAMTAAPAARRGPAGRRRLRTHLPLLRKTPSAAVAHLVDAVPDRRACLDQHVALARRHFESARSRAGAGRAGRHTSISIGRRGIEPALHVGGARPPRHAVAPALGGAPAAA
jgi:hypothetical protein